MYKDKKIFVLGMGRSGIAVSKFLCKENQVLLTDVKCDDSNLISELQALGINVVITDEQDSLLNESYDYVIKNPAIFPENKTVVKAKQLNIPVINEMEVAYNLLPTDVKIVGITGSNGKTTTTLLTYEMLKVAGLPVHIGGNIGIPLCDLVNEVKSGDILVLEISSHQLLDFDKFKTDISVLTNFSEVHLDLFKTYENYKKNKLRIFGFHDNSNVAIINSNDKEVLEYTKNILSGKVYFNSEVDADICIRNSKIYYKEQEVCELNDIRVKGKHNYENVMCAIGAAKEFGVNNEKIREALANFSGATHRMEFVRRFNDREFYNDSKATNNKSTTVALSAFNTPVILLLGGLDRGQSFDELREYMQFVKEVICFGETKNKIVDFCNSNDKSVTAVENLEEAVRLAYNLSDEGDTILLSPACASHDQFKSFEERGDKFREIVEGLR
ncbi:MAG: UDP-N-acetylmuramoyl-L-alanine--D-glutamate ligase [Bacilli bacterium]|nr:UDP-N-acetylmuramoyl-L-alanine--D-glutamate ligase [Bacilli bacterium]